MAVNTFGTIINYYYYYRFRYQGPASWRYARTRTRRYASISLSTHKHASLACSTLHAANPGLKSTCLLHSLFTQSSSNNPSLWTLVLGFGSPNIVLIFNCRCCFYWRPPSWLRLRAATHTHSLKHGQIQCPLMLRLSAKALVKHNAVVYRQGANYSQLTCRKYENTVCISSLSVTCTLHPVRPKYRNTCKKILFSHPSDVVKGGLWCRNWSGLRVWTFWSVFTETLGLNGSRISVFALTL